MKGVGAWLVIGAAVAFAIGAVGASAGQQRAEAGPGYKVVGTWGKGGTGNGQFNGVAGITVDQSGNVYVADLNNGRVQVFSPTGTFLRKWGSYGNDNDQFLGVSDVAVAPDGTVWLADYGNGRAQQFKPDGTLLTSVGLAFGEEATGVGFDADGNLYVSVIGETHGGVRRFDKTPTGWQDKGLIGRGDWRSEDTEVALDGTVYQLADQSAGGDPHIRRYSTDGKALGSFAPGGGGGFRFGVDLDCNVWVLDAPNRRDVKYSPSGKRLATATSEDLVAVDTAMAPKGDLYVAKNASSVVHFVADRKKPATANVPGRISVKGGKATIRYGATGFACPAQVTATATLKGKGVSGRGTAKVAAGKFTAIPMTVHGATGQSVKATFTIVLKTNGRPTTETKRVVVSFGK
jgi:NHL repeat-containing protein